MSTQRFIVGALAVASVATGLTFAATRSGGTVEALDFTVDVFAPSDDVAPGDRVCADAAGHCSLRAAIIEVEALSGENSILLPAGDHDLGGAITVTSNLNITRSDWSVAAPNPVIDLDDGPGFRVELGKLTFQGIDIVNGLDPDRTGGAAVYGVGAEIGLFDGEFRNHRTDGYGGVVFVTNGTVRVAGATFVDNAALGGGAIAGVGIEFTAQSSTFETNGASGGGGAVHLLDPSHFSIDGTTFTNNTALDQGGALYIRGQSSRGSRQLLSPTFDGNSAGNEGGAV
ncbi:MAG: hypothetical protein WBP59_06935, partial [Ilumatobacteraceae bacterium]